MRLENVQETADLILEYLKKRGVSTLRLATPLGLGKLNHLLNEIYRRIKVDSSLQLEIYTALSYTRLCKKTSLGVVRKT